MRGDDSVELVLIARDFLAAHRILRQIVRLHREGSLTFDQVRTLVGDDEASVLYRLKEHSHARFRYESASDADVAAEALFDLAVGSLFHEAMKFRENFYQRTAYGPKIEALRRSDLPEAERLRHEFEKILADAGERIEESLAEAETLLHQSAQLFRVLLQSNAENGLLTRYLLEHQEDLAAVLEIPPDRLLESIHGSAADAWSRGARSYLASGFFAEAAHALARAAQEGPVSEDAAWLHDYACGMQAYLEGRYPEVLSHLEAWLDRAEGHHEPALVDQAHSAVSRLGGLFGPHEQQAMAARATALTGRIESLMTEE